MEKMEKPVDAAHLMVVVFGRQLEQDGIHIFFFLISRAGWDSFYRYEGLIW
jgi:hypothetical protein